MTDPLAERFLALAETRADDDWLDVRRRARRRKPIILVVVLAATVCVAAALAATSPWRFGLMPFSGHATVEATVELHGHPYTVFVEQSGGDGRFFTMRLYDGASHDHELVLIWGGSLLHTAGLPDNPLIPRQLPHGPAMYGMNWRVGPGEVWFGDARPEVTRIVLTDTAGRRFTADTVSPPRGVKSAFRYWTLALQSSYATEIAAYDRRGKLVDRRSLFPSRLQTLH